MAFFLERYEVTTD